MQKDIKNKNGTCKLAETANVRIVATAVTIKVAKELSLSTQF